MLKPRARGAKLDGPPVKTVVGTVLDFETDLKCSRHKPIAIEAKTICA
jgi:hypothetical protein